jgi:hypothetical protein
MYNSEEKQHKNIKTIILFWWNLNFICTKINVPQEIVTPSVAFSREYTVC